MNNIKYLSGLIMTLLVAFSSCTKEAGEGGTSTIVGRIKMVDFDWNPVDGIWEYNEENYAQEERVYIIYGEDSIHSNDFRTDPDGYYRFQWLRKGKYTIYAYTEDTLDKGNTVVTAKEVEVEITKNKVVVEAPEIILIR